MLWKNDRLNFQSKHVEKYTPNVNKFHFSNKHWLIIKENFYEIEHICLMCVCVQCCQHIQLRQINPKKSRDTTKWFLFVNTYTTHSVSISNANSNLTKYFLNETVFAGGNN